MLDLQASLYAELLFPSLNFVYQSYKLRHIGRHKRRMCQVWYSEILGNTATRLRNFGRWKSKPIYINTLKILIGFRGIQRCTRMSESSSSVNRAKVCKSCCGIFFKIFQILILNTLGHFLLQPGSLSSPTILIAVYFKQPRMIILWYFCNILLI